MQNFGVTNKEHYGMLWYFLEWSILTLYVCRYQLLGSLWFAVSFSNMLIIVLILGNFVHESHASFDFKITAGR